ncbi:NADP-dependent oxidoreductase [soil metagenome]
MKALTIREYGGVDKFQLQELNMPQPAADEVLIEVHCAAINPLDWKIRRGDLRVILSRNFPKTIGSDVAGIVNAVGGAVSKFKVGDRVFGLCDNFHSPSGSYAQFCLAPAKWLTLLPESVSFADAASLPVAALTAYKGLFEHGGVEAGQWAFINGAAGGVGSFAVQLAKERGVLVTAACGPNNIDFVRSLGADEVLNYKEKSISDTNHKYQVFLDASAKSSFFKVKNHLTNKGVYVTTVPSASLFLALPITLPFSGQKAEVVLATSGNETTTELDHLARLVAESKLVPYISKTVSLEEVAEAHREAEGEHTRGKVVVQVQ